MFCLVGFGFSLDYAWFRVGWASEAQQIVFEGLFLSILSGRDISKELEALLRSFEEKSVPWTFGNARQLKIEASDILRCPQISSLDMFDMFDMSGILSENHTHTQGVSEAEFEPLHQVGRICGMRFSAIGSRFEPGSAKTFHGGPTIHL